MNVQQAYDKWSESYDSVINKTRDLEAAAIRELLRTYMFNSILELGCGTGKNTEFLSSIGRNVTAVDFSFEMLDKAKAKQFPGEVSFVQADITKPWDFLSSKTDLITCSLILEHIEDISSVFANAAKVIQPNGYFYIGELHPFKQYQGSKARFETGDGIHKLECFTHHISDFIEAAEKNNFTLVKLNEWFDEEDKSTTPRLITFIFQYRPDQNC